MLEKKLTNLRILEQFEYLPDMLRTYHREKRWENVFAYRPRENSVNSHTTAVSRALFTEHNKSAQFFIRSICTTIYPLSYFFSLGPRYFFSLGPRYQKNEMFLEFFETLASF